VSEIQPSGNAAELRSNSAKLKAITFNNRAALEQMVQDKISSNKVMIFSKSNCPFCKKAKAAVEGAGESLTPHIDDTLIDTTYRSTPHIDQGASGRRMPHIGDEFARPFIALNSLLWVFFFRRNSV
jgi:glutaredoxin